MVLYFELHIIIILIALFPNTATVGSLEHDLVYNMFTWFSRKMFPYHHWLVNVKTDPQNKELIIHSNYFFLYTRKLKCRDVKDDASVYLVTKLRGHVFPNSCTYHTLPIWISPPPRCKKIIIQVLCKWAMFPFENTEMLKTLTFYLFSLNRDNISLLNDSSFRIKSFPSGDLIFVFLSQMTHFEN